MTRLRGWAPKGERLVDKVPQGKWKTATFLALFAMTASMRPACSTARSTANASAPMSSSSSSRPSSRATSSSSTISAPTRGRRCGRPSELSEPASSSCPNTPPTSTRSSRSSPSSRLCCERPKREATRRSPTQALKSSPTTRPPNAPHTSRTQDTGKAKCRRLWSPKRRFAASRRLRVKAIERVPTTIALVSQPRLCAMSVLLEMIGRGWENFLARPNGSLSLRFYVQPTMASLLALRAGIQDARQGRRGYLWAILTQPERRLQLLHEGWRGAMTPFLLAIALDCIYQLMTVRFVYPLELLFTATLLALVPYALLRGPFNRLARLFLPAAQSAPAGRPAQNNKFIR